MKIPRWGAENSGMEIYLDANATTPVLPQAQAAALAAMAQSFGNPSSIHGSGLKARALLDQARATARRVLGVSSGQLLFTSGATEGIQTAVLSALCALRRRREAGEAIPPTLLYGATEHKAVPEALKHWNAVLGLGLELLAIPVDADGRHDLAWLGARAGAAGLVATMAANNETGVLSDLDGIGRLLRGTGALWLVDGVQALGKLPLALEARGIDYAPFSGHKLYAPKGIGMLYVRDGAPFTPLLAGGGQEGSLRSGTENMAGIAALDAVLAALESPEVFAPPAELQRRREHLVAALREAFPGIRFHAPFATSLPTTLNFSVPGLGSKLLLDLFDAAGLRVSGGSACGAGKAEASHVLQAMGLPSSQAASAVRLSFGAADDASIVDEACRRIRACGDALRATCRLPAPGRPPAVPERLTRWVVDGACCYVVADARTRRCVVIDPLPVLTGPLAQWMQCRDLTLVATLETPRQGEPASGAGPEGAAAIDLGNSRLTRLPLPGDTRGSTAYLLHDDLGVRAAFVGDALGAEASVQALSKAVGPDTLLLPGRDDDERFATTLRIERATTALPAGASDADGDGVEMSAPTLRRALEAAPPPRLVDVREDYEERLGPLPGIPALAVPLSTLVDALPRLREMPAESPLVFVCRSGNRSARAARALRRLGHANAWSLAGGLALWS